MAKHNSQIIGASGEYFVAAYLSAMGLVVALPRGGIPSSDLIVTRGRGGRAITLQVKTGTQSHRVYTRKPENNDWLWDTSFKAMHLADESHWYAFVHLDDWPSQGDGYPEVLFVPSKKVAKFIRQQHDDGWQRPFFIMAEAEAELYRGLAGYRKLAKTLR